MAAPLTDAAPRLGCAEQACQPTIVAVNFTSPRADECGGGWKKIRARGRYYGRGGFDDARGLGGSAHRGVFMGPYLRRELMRPSMGVLGAIGRRSINLRWTWKFYDRGLPLTGEFASGNNLRDHRLLSADGQQDLASSSLTCLERWGIPAISVDLGRFWSRSVASKSFLLCHPGNRWRSGVRRWLGYWRRRRNHW
jgi:hypothetical protein